jgi:lysozyme
MRISLEGKNLIKSFESLELSAYPDPATGGEPWTIGYGHTSQAGSPKVFKGLRVTRSEAEDILDRDLLRYEAGVEGAVKVPLEQHQFDALVSFAFNCGLGNFQKSTLLKRVNAKEFNKVPAEFMKWTRANGKEMNGLVRRRREEAALWRGLAGQGTPPAHELRTKPDKPQPSKSITNSTEANASLVIGGAAVAGAVKEATPVIQNAADAYTAATGAFGTPAVLIALVVAALAVFIWWKRKQRLDEEGA